MPLQLPHLDTRRWADLVDEARAAIPRLAPDWTDHNAHDPGITLLELLAALVEQDIYRVNRVPARVRRKLLALVDVTPRGPSAARVALTFVAEPGRDPGPLPAGVVVSGRDDAGTAARFSLLEPVDPGPSRLAAVQAFDGVEHHDRTRALAERTAFAALGPDPAPGSAADDSPALLLGLDPPPPAGRELVVWVSPAAHRELDAAAEPALPHTVRLAWELLGPAGWVAVPSVSDGTRGLTRAATVRLTPAATPPAVPVGVVPAPMAWLRARLVAGPPDAAPLVSALALHTVPAEQAVAVHSDLPVAPGVLTPATGTEVRLALALDAAGAVTALVSDPPSDAPPVRILAAGPGRLAIDAAIVGRGSGEPEQELALPGAPVLADSVALWTTDGATAGPIALRDDLDASGRQDAHAVLDPVGGELRLGDGRRGRVVPPAELVVAAYATTDGAGGNVRAGATWALAGEDAFHNGALLGRPVGAVSAALAAITNGQAATGGAGAEDLDEAAGRAAARVWAHERLLELLDRHGAVSLDDLPVADVLALPAPERGLTLADLERIALDVPGTAVSRARAWPEVDPRLPALRAPGSVTVVILPSLPVARPHPTPELLCAVRAHLERRRIVGTQVFVVGPSYLEVTVEATVAVLAGADVTRVAEAVRERLVRFLHPRHGGPRGTGWPFGRDVYRSEVMQVADEAAGVDHVEALALRGAGGELLCGNLCVPATSLVVSGPHAITAVRA